MTIRQHKFAMIRPLALLSSLVFSWCAACRPASAAQPATAASQAAGGDLIQVLVVGGRGHDWNGFYKTIDLSLIHI